MTTEARNAAPRRDRAETSAPSRPSRPTAGSGPARSADDRQADHQAIDRLADELVPALIAKLSATGLGEIEVGEGDWTIRVRRPADGGRQERKSPDRASRAQPGHAGHHAAGGFDSHRPGREGRGSVVTPSNNGTEPSRDDRDASVADLMNAHRAIATSPAVGTFQPRADAKTGTRVRAGDRLGAVDMLGIPQDVVAPADGIVGASLVEPGEAVEYGQELVVIELAARGDRAGGGPAASVGGDA